MKSKILGYIFLGLVFAAAVGAVYWWQKPRGSKQITVNSNQNDQTANWKTYTNRQYGFEFKYPASYYLTTQNAIFSDDQSPELKRLNQDTSFANSQWLRVGVSPVNQEILKLAKDLASKNSDSNWRVYNENTSEKIVELNRIKTRLSIVIGYPENDAYNIYGEFYDQKGDMIFLGLDKIGKTKEIAESNPIVNTFLQILSTFKSINQSNQTNLGTLSGKVSIGPICPVEREGMPCTPSPEIYAAHEFLVLSGQAEIARFHADASGKYSLSLQAGSYTVTTAKRGFGYASKDLPHTIIIKANQATTLNIDIDTGIR